MSGAEPEWGDGPLAEGLAGAYRKLEQTYRARRADQIGRWGWLETVACAECGDTGLLPPQHAKPCGCSRGRRIEEERANAARWQQIVPRAMREWRLEDTPDATAGLAVRAWLDADPARTGRNLLLLGEPGVGKTGLAVGALRWLMERGVNVGFVVLADWLDDQRPAGGESGAAAAAKLAKRRVLAVDDVGVEKVSEWVAERVYLLANNRMNAGLPTIWTSNLPVLRLEEAVGPRIARRIMQDGDADVVTVRPVR